MEPAVGLILPVNPLLGHIVAQAATRMAAMRGRLQQSQKRHAPTLRTARDVGGEFGAGSAARTLFVVIRAIIPQTRAFSD
jgi:hypothetical protein